MSLGLPERCILPLLMTLILGSLTIGGTLVLCTRPNQRDLRKYLELHRFGCYSLLTLILTLRFSNSIYRICQPS